MEASDSGEVKLIAKGDIETLKMDLMGLWPSLLVVAVVQARLTCLEELVSAEEKVAPLALRPSVLVEWVVAQEMHKA